MGAPVNTGLASRFGRWCSSWTPTNIAKSYVEDSKRILNQADSTGGFIIYIEHLADISPDITQHIKDNLPGGNWLIGGNEKDVQRGIFLQIAAHLTKQYLQNKRDVPFNQIIVEIAKGLTETARTKMDAQGKTPRFYEMAQDILSTFPLLGSIHSLIERLANILKDIHESANAPLDYDVNDKLVSTVLSLNTKIIKFAKQEVKTFPKEKIKEEFQPIFAALAPVIADDPAFAFLWTNLTNRLPSLVHSELVYLRELLHAANDEELIANLKADFKDLYEKGRNDPKILAQTILWRYFRPILHSKQIPEFLRPWIKSKLTEILAAKLAEHREKILEFISDRVQAPAAPAPAPIAEPAAAPAPREAVWYERYLPEAFAVSYRRADEAYLAEINRGFLNLVNDLSLKLPVPAPLKSLFGANADVILQALFLHFAANLCKTIYKDARGPYELERIVHDITFYFHKYFNDALHLNPPVTEKSFYEPTKAFLVGICPELGDVPYIFEFAAKIVHEVYLSKEMPATHDKDDKLVESVAKFTHKILAYVKKEIKVLPNNDLIKEPFKTLAKIILPIVADNPMFKAAWDHIETRIPSLLQLVMNHLRALLRPADDEDLIVKLKADFKAQWQAVPNDFPRLSENLVNRYLSPIFDSIFIPATFKQMIKRKVIAVVAEKLQENIVKIEDALEIRKAHPVLPVYIVAAPAAEPGFFDKYTPQAIAKSYRDENEAYLRDLIGSDKLIVLVKNLSHKVPNLTVHAPEFLKTMINGSADELHEGIFVHLVASLCKTIYEGKEKPNSETEVIQTIVSHLSKMIKATFDKADTTRELKAEDFKATADQLIKSLLPELGEIPYAIDPVAKLLYECYLFSRITPIVPVQDPLNATAANYKEKMIEFVREQAADVKNSDTLNEIDPNLGNITDQLLKTFSQDPIFKGIWMFVEKQIPSLMQTELVYLKNLLGAESNRELFIRLAIDFGGIWRTSRQNPEALTRAILQRYFDHILNSALIPATFKPLIVPMIEEKLMKFLLKNQANIDAALTAFELEREVLLRDPLQEYSQEARQVVHALAKRFYPTLAKNLPKEVTKELGEAIMEESLYHVFGRLQLKFRARNYKELQSRIIGYTHEKLSVLVRSAQIEDTIYKRMAKELLDEVAPGVNAFTFVAQNELAEYLKTLVEITNVREPRELGFGELNQEMKPFLYSIVDFILKKALEKPIEIIPELVLNPVDLKNDETLRVARETLYKHLATGFGQFFGNGGGIRTLLSMFSQYGEDRANISGQFTAWVNGFGFDAGQAPSISEEDGIKAHRALLDKVEPSKQSYLNDLLNRWSEGKLENKWLLCRHLMLSLNLNARLDELKPKLELLERQDKEMGAAIMGALLPTLGRDKYPDLFDNVTDMLSSPLLRLMGQIPEKLMLHSKEDLESLAKPQIHPAATILSKISALTDAISESAEESHFAIGKKLAAFFVEIGVSHLIVNNDNDINLLIAALAEHNFLVFSEDELKEYAKELIKTLCPVLAAFSPSSEEMIVKLLKIAKSKIPSNDRKASLNAIGDILFDPNDHSDHHITDLNRYKHQIDTAVYAFAGLIIKWTRAYGENKLPESLKQLVKVEGPLLVHSQEVIAALLMKALLNFIKKVEAINPGPRNTLFGRSLYVLINTVVTKLPDIKEGNFKDLSDALWGLFDLDKEVAFDLNEIRREVLPKLLMEYSKSIRKYIDEMPVNAKELVSIFYSNALPELLRVLGTVWLRDFIPYFLNQNTEELSKTLLTEINGFFESTVLQEGDSSFITNAIKELLKKREDGAMNSVYTFAGLYAAAYMLKFCNNLFKKRKIDGLAQEIARRVVSKAATYYSKVVEVKGRRPHAYKLSTEELKEGLKELFSNGMPLHGEELSDSQKAFYGQLTGKLEAAGDADNPESVPMIDFLQGPVHNLLTNKLLPSVLNSVFKNVGSRKSINTLLKTLLEKVTESVESDWDRLEDAYHKTLCNIDDLNYRLNGNNTVHEIKELVKEAKTQYGADSKQVMDILKFVDEAVKNENGITLERIMPGVDENDNPLSKLKKGVEMMIDPLKKLAEIQDESLAEDLSKLRDAIVHLVPKQLLANLLKIEAFNEMASNQLGVLYNNKINGMHFEEWVNMGAEVLMNSLIPNGVYENNHFGPRDPSMPLKVEHTEVVYTEEEARADEKSIVDGLAEVAANGTYKGIIHSIKNYIRDLSMKIGQLLIKWFGVRIIPLRKAYTAMVDLISFILAPLVYVLSHLFSAVVKFVGTKVWRREIEPHIRGFHADYNQNVILLLMEDLVALLTNGKSDDKENLQDNHAGV